MAVKIRLTLTGKRNMRSFRIVAIDQKERRDGKAIEYLGYYDPNNKKVPVKVDNERLAYWTSKGAFVTDAVKKLIKNQ